MHRLRRLLLALTAAVCLIATTALIGPPVQAGARPSVTLGVSDTRVGSGEQVELSGAANVWLRAATVTAQVQDGRAWHAVASEPLGRDRSYSFAVGSVLGDNDFRVVVTVRGLVVATSPTRTVVGLLAADPAVVVAGSPVTVSGRLPTAVERPVVLHRVAGEVQLPSLGATSEADGSVSFTFVPVVGEVVSVYAAPVARRGPDLLAFASPTLSLTVVGTPPETPDATMPEAVVGEPYSAALPTGPRLTVLKLVAGSLPAGLRLYDANGYLTGTPTRAGRSVFTVTYGGLDGPERRTVALVTRGEAPPAADGLTRVNVGGYVTVPSGDGSTFVTGASVHDPGTPYAAASSSLFTWDRASRAFDELSVASDQATPDGDSAFPAISADGRWVAFFSNATNLVAGQPSASPGWGVYVADTRTRKVERVADDRLTCECRLAISADGRFLAYPRPRAGVTDSRYGTDVVVLDRTTGTTRLVSHAADDPTRGVSGRVAGISDDGRLVTFVSASDEVTADDDHPGNDVFQWDADTSTSVRVTADVSSDAYLGRPSVASPDGRFVAYQLITGMLVGTSYLWDRETGETTAVPDPEAATGRQLTDVAALSADGRYAVLNLMTTLGSHAYRWDRETGETVRLESGEVAGEPVASSSGQAISDDGRLVTLTAYGPGAAYATLWNAEG